MESSRINRDIFFFGNFSIPMLVVFLLLPDHVAWPMEMTFVLGQLLLLIGGGILFWQLLLRTAGLSRWECLFRVTVYGGMAYLGAGLILLGTCMIGYFPWFYNWAEPGVGSAREFYLNRTGIVVRFCIYGVVLAGMITGLWMYVRKNILPSGKTDERIRKPLRTVCAVCLPVFLIVFSLLSVDSVMARNSGYHVPLWPFHFLAVSALAGMAFLVGTTARVHRVQGIDTEENRRMFSDMGNLLLALALLRGYTGYSIWMIGWFGGESLQITDKTPVAMCLAISWLLSLLLPFILLLFSSLKKNLIWMRWISLSISFGVAVEIGCWAMLAQRGVTDEYPPSGKLVCALVAAGIWWAIWLRKGFNTREGKEK